MVRSISRLRKHPLLPTFAILASLFLITGQLFNCCRINESIADDIAKWLQAAHLLNPKPNLHGKESAEHLSYCHGHGVKSPHPNPSSVIAQAGQAEPNVAPEESCLGENAITAKVMAASQLPTLDLPKIAMTFREKISPKNSVCPENPRPQNKSSPPVYLTTLHLLV